MSSNAKRIRELELEGYNLDDYLYEFDGKRGLAAGHEVEVDKSWKRLKEVHAEIRRLKGE